MPEFLSLLSPPEALRRLFDSLPTAPVKAEKVDTICSLGRVTAQPVYATHGLPTFRRSTVDGYAVRAIDTFGASDSLPVYSLLAGEVCMGQESGIFLRPSNCALIHTGGMLPDGADSVVMLEYAQASRPGEIEIYRPVSVGENVIQVGEDIAAGVEVVSCGVRLGPPEIGGLMALGFTQVAVARKPKIGIISTGDEIVAPDKLIHPGQVRDVNSYSLSALFEGVGGISSLYGIFPDQLDGLICAAKHAIEECDVLVISAGSSASARDITVQVIQALGEPGVLVHGINIKPGKPTILAVCNEKVVVGLPGNPVSALVIASLFVVPVVESLLGRRPDLLSEFDTHHISVRARLTTNIPSEAGREDWVPVRLIATQNGYDAEPIFGKSNLIFTLVRADGMIRIPADETGKASGNMVEVNFLY